MMKRLAAIALAVLGSATAGAATAPAASPNCLAAEYHQLDFWIGDWDTFEYAGPSGASEARTHVDLIAQGCGLHELYEQDDGLIGDSLLSFDPVRKQWQQTWITNRGSLMVITGVFKDGQLTLEGEVHRNDGGTALQRISWRAEAGGVREWGVISRDNGATWSPAFDVMFREHKKTHK